MGKHQVGDECPSCGAKWRIGTDGLLGVMHRSSCRTHPPIPGDKTERLADLGNKLLGPESP